MAAGYDEDREGEDMQDQIGLQPISSPVARKQRATNGHRGASVESGGSRMDSPSRQLNGHFDGDALPELPPGPETQEMLDLIRNEAKKHGRVNQVHNLEALLGRFGGDL